MIYTFYSFKGGVGRSMALANVAEILHRRNLKVLVVDFDLEAPGLERYFTEILPAGMSLPFTQQHPGVVDLLEKYKELRRFAASRVLPPDATLDQRLAVLATPAFEEYLIDIDASAERRGLALMTAGSRSQYAEYASRVISLDWVEFYGKQEGELFFEWFRREAEKRFDAVLIDSRTGVTEMSGVCTHQLADVVVNMVAANAQNVDGVLTQARALANRSLIELGRRGRQLYQIIVPSRVETSEGDQAKLFQTALQASLAEAFPDGVPGQGQLAFNELMIPYVPVFAFNERVPAREPDHPLAKLIVEPISKLTTLMASFAPLNSLLYLSHHSTTAQLCKIGEELVAAWENDRKAQARAVFNRLVSVSLGRHGSTFAPTEVPLSDFPAPLIPMAQEFVTAGLLVMNPRNGEPVLGFRDPQVTIEWDRLNRWIRGDLVFLAWLQRVSAGRAEWSDSHSVNDLLSGTPLKESYSWLRSKAIAINEREREFVLESQKHEQAKRETTDGVPEAAVDSLESSDPNRPLLTHIRFSRERAAIVFIHGFGGDPKLTWGDFPSILRDEPRLPGWDLFTIGYATSLAPDVVGLWRTDAPVDRLALLLSTTFGLAPLNSYDALAIVAHSMGGLIVQRALLDDSELCKRTSHVFLFGTPSAGLVKAGIFSFLKRQARDISEHSPFIEDLRAKWNTRFGSSGLPFRFRAIAGDQDEFVPSSSSLGPFPTDQRFVVPGNHSQIVKLKSGADSASVQLVLNGLAGKDAVNPRTAARLAIESRQFQQAVDTLLPNASELDDRGLVDLGLALEQVGRRAEAIELLQRNRQRDDLDATGVLAGRLKRRWLAERRRSDGDRSLELYTEGLAGAEQRAKHDQALYHGINVAFMQLAYLSDIEAARRSASKVLEHCALAKEDHWTFAAEGEAHMILGHTREALSKYQQALDAHPTEWAADSIYQQALRVADLAGDEQALGSLPGIFGREPVSAF